MKRREFIALIGGLSVAGPRLAHAQPALPVVGLLDPRSPEVLVEAHRALREGLKETGYVDGETVSIEYRWAGNQLGRLPELAADLVRRRVAVIIASGGEAAAFAAKEATTTIPIVFISGQDPVRLGLVSSLARPDGNLTGVNFFSIELAAKRLELLREMAPQATRIAVLVNPALVATTKSTLQDVEVAARAMGLQIKVFNADSSRDIDSVFATLGGERPDALFVSGSPYFTSRRVQLAILAGRLGIPATFANRQVPEVGGLMSYGASQTDTYRQIGAYAGRILKGAKPGDLPVTQSNKFDLVINAQTARTLGLTVPHSLLARADEVIE